MGEILSTIKLVQTVASWISVAFVVMAFVPYVLAILRRKTRPAKASWIVWAVLDIIMCASMALKDALNIQIILGTFTATTIMLLALKYGESGWKRVDKLCIGGAGLAVVLGLVTGEANVALALTIVSMLIGAIPTFENAWRDPSKENGTAWTLYWFSCAAILVALPAWDFAHAGQPLTFTFIETVMVWLTVFRKPASTSAPASVSA